jgi:diguanylate cyclase (GGDEF)-like protein
LILEFLKHLATRVRGLLSADTDQALVRARSDGEKLVALLRLGLILAFTVVTVTTSLGRNSWKIQLLTCAVALAYGSGMLALATHVRRPWVPWVTTAVDIGLITLALSLYLVDKNPLGAVNNKIYFETYFFVIVTGTLRYDWRLCALATVLAVGGFLGITMYTVQHWDLSTLSSPVSGTFQPVGHTLRITLLAAVGGSSVAVAHWARHLRLMVGTDHLTGLSQRRPFLERVHEELERSSSSRATLSLALLDVDEFKKFNDTFGHLAGDRALQLLAERLRKSVRTSDLVARFGGEEFVVAFPRMDVERAVKRINELRAELGAVPIAIPGEGAKHLTLSAGVGSWPADGETFEAVLAKIDERLYEAKSQGRNRVVGPRSHLRPVADG